MAYTIPPTNQSVSGVVGASIIGLPAVSVSNFPVAQSVSGTIQTDVRGSVATVIIGGSITTTTGNSSVQVLNFPTNQSVSGDVRIIGSVVMGAAANQSVSGTVNLGLGTTTIGSVVLSGGVNAIGSVTTLQGTNPWIITGSVQGAGAGTQYLENAITPSVTGTAVMFKSNTSSSIVSVVTPSTPLPISGSVSGTVNLGLGTTTIGSVVLSGGVNAIGSVATLQGTVPWIVSSVYGNISGSVVAFPTGNQSVSGTVNLGVGTTTIGSVTVIQGTNPFIITGSIQGGGAGTQYIENAITPSVTGTAVMFKSNISSSIMSVVTPSTPLPVMGSVATLQGTTPWQTIVGGSVIALIQGSSLISINAGSVFTVSLGSIITVNQSSSVIAVVTGSVTSAGAQSSSIYGTRNDAVTSFLGADLTIRPIATDSAGRQLIKPFVSEDSSIISYVGSTVSGSVQLIAASIIGRRPYITDFWISNTGATTTLVTFQDGTTSLIGQFIAPAGGGMVSTGINIPLTTVSSVGTDLAFKVAPSTSVLYLTLKGYQGP